MQQYIGINSSHAVYAQSKQIKRSILKLSESTYTQTELQSQQVNYCASMFEGMPFLNFFRDWIRGKNPEEPRNEGFFNHGSYNDSFRNPIWQNDEDDDDVDDFRRPRNDIYIKIFGGDMLQMTRFFEAEMDNIIKSFFSGFGNDSMFSLPNHNEPLDVVPFTPPQKENLRDEILKPNFGSLDQFTQNDSKLDADLDGKITADEFSKIWGNQNEKKESGLLVPHQHRIETSIRKEFFHGLDGIMEQRQIFRDSEGNEKTVVSRQHGDKVYTVTTKRDKHGVETKTEDIVNIDESELKDFNHKWALPGGSSTNPDNSILNHFPWEKFFGPNPKL